MQRGKLLANVLYKVIRTELNLAQILGQSLPAPNAFTSIIYRTLSYLMSSEVYFH